MTPPPGDDGNVPKKGQFEGGGGVRRKREKKRKGASEAKEWNKKILSLVFFFLVLSSFPFSAIFTLVQTVSSRRSISDAITPIHRNKEICPANLEPQGIWRSRRKATMNRWDWALTLMLGSYASKKATRRLAKLTVSQTGLSRWLTNTCSYRNSLLPLELFLGYC